MPAPFSGVFPTQVGGGPGNVSTVVLTVTATGATSTNPCKSLPNAAAYYAASAADKARHDRWSDIVMYFHRNANPVGIEATANNVITLHFEQENMFDDTTLGTPGWYTASGNPRPNAFDIAQEYVADNDHTVTVITVTVDGTAQTA